MLAAIRSAAVLGIDACQITVEVDVAAGLPAWMMVGLPAGSVKEARERVMSALKNSGFEMPPRRVTVNLAPADLPKSGTAYDLPIALGVLVATGQLRAHAVATLTAIGELGLDGSIRPVRGVLSVARATSRGQPGGLLVVPVANVAEAQLVGDARVVAWPTLAGLVDALRAGGLAPLDGAALAATASDADGGDDLADVVGQRAAKRALEIAAAGDHALLLQGPPGAGKTMLARRLPGILPPLTEAEALEVIAIHSVAGLLTPERLASPRRPFRAPHHTTSVAGLIGGGGHPRPGEVSLAHGGVLFFDELLETPRYVLDALRQPMEDRCVTIARAAQAVSFPARFTLVGATNPCPCGRAGEPGDGCRCSAADIERYRGRLSGPLIDRIDLHVTVGRVRVEDLGRDATDATDAAGGPGTARRPSRGSQARGEHSADVRARVVAARERQRERYASLPGLVTNGAVPARWLERHGQVDPAARALLLGAAERLRLSARGYHRVLRVARTIADLDGDPSVGDSAMAEALRYRPIEPSHVRSPVVPEAGGAT
ncbi:MAG: YifB family Mg chelatase-like AAA ATPase [Gemmatimonadetes bacterium]|nr:YifB family Mg chelatase-like AAA ATPase [Gemmatimonadota bacterium]